VRIAVDAREMAERPTGVGRYLAELLASWSRDRQALGTSVTLYAPDPIQVAPSLIGSGGATVGIAIIPGGRGTRCEQTTLPRTVKSQADVLFCPGYSAPVIRPVPFVVAIHDLSFWAHPEWFARRERIRRRWTTAWAARRAAHVLTISQFSKAEIVRWLGVPASKVTVTPLAPARRFEAASVRREPAALPDGREPLVLFVGSLLNRRHLPTLVRAFAPIARDTPRARLVIVGDNRTFPREDPDAVARELDIAGQVEVRSYVADTELAALYRGASVFAFLSTYEGFGLTPLEAMSAGVPVVAYDTAVGREVYGNAAVLVQPGDIAGVTAALRDAIDDSQLRARLFAAASTCLSRWSWDVTARTTLDVLVQASGTRR
jgi:glycosyltransferase involved in cell wall biosynthesis